MALGIDIPSRLANLRSSLDKNNIDTLMVLIEENRRYLSGFTGEDTQFDESAGALFITANRQVLATDSRYVIQAQKEAPFFEVFCYEKGLAKALPGLLSDLYTDRIGFESARMSVYQHRQILEKIGNADRKVELVPTQELVETLRMVKDEKEIQRIRQALELSETVFLSVAATLRPGMTEKAVAWELEKGMREAGAERLSFPTIVASGPNSALPHAVPGDRRFRSGEPILFDWGARLDGYCADISRTLVLGSADETFHKIYDTVAEAQQMAIAAIRAGKSTRDVDAVAREHIDRMGFEGKFGHSLGHGAGLAVHEPPRLSPLKDTPLRSGMVTTVEPGIYLEGWGGVRLENMVAVRKDGAEVLNRLDATNCPVEL